MDFRLKISPQDLMVFCIGQTKIDPDSIYTGIFIHPGGVDGDASIIQRNAEGYLEETDVDSLEGAKSLIMNHRAFVGSNRFV